MKIYDFTKEAWQEMLPNCMEIVNGKYANDNRHEWWIYDDNIHVPSLFDYADMAAIRRKNFEVVK